jgi:hypothetical protein
MATPLAQTAAAIAMNFGLFPQRQHAGRLPQIYEAAARAAKVFLETIEGEVAWGDEADYVQTLYNYSGRILDYMADNNHEIPDSKHLKILAKESIYYFMEPKFPAPFSQADAKILRDLLATAFEGGIGSWAQIIGYVYPAGSKAEDFGEGGSRQIPGDYYPRYVLLPLTPGGAVILRDVEEDPDPPERVLKEMRVKAEKAKRTIQRHYGEEPEGSEPEYPQPHPEEVEAWGKLKLDLAAVHRGWTMLQIQYPKVYQRILDESYDANDGDLFVQLSLFGEQVYG